MADLATEIPAYGALVLAGATFLWSEHRYRSARTAKRAAGPATDTRDALEGARRDFDEIISLGGQTQTFFLDERRRESGQRLHDLSDRTEDPSLSAALLEVSIAWDNASAYAPPPPVARFVDLSAPPGESPEEAERRRKKELQVDVARDGREKCQMAIDRLNELERNVGQ